MLKLNDSQLVRNSSYINGDWQLAELAVDVVNPANNQVIAQVTNAGKEQAVQAIVSAKSAFVSWSALSAYQRSNLLIKWRELIIEHQEDLARLLTLEQGKPLAEARGEISYGASYLQWFAEESKRVYGDTIPAAASDKRLFVIKQPIGVVTAITPWNFPHAMIVRKAAAALAAGCTFVVRPAMETPLSALALAELAQRAGIPAGVFNIVISQDASGVGKILTEHPDVAKFTFTGSTQTGRLLMGQCATGIKKSSMELGGNAPFIVFDDADIDAAVAGAIASKYRNAGQTCICTNRLFIHHEVLTEFTEKFTRAVQKLVVGDGLTEGIDIGPMISATAVAKVDKLVQESIKAGAELVCGGQPSTVDGSFYLPTVLTQVTNEMVIAREEIFGPVSAIISFSDEQEVLTMANSTDYGLAAYFYARDIGRVWRVAEALEFGMVGINDTMISNAAAPFGGVKHSGNGREGSKYGLDDYLEIKYLSMGGLN